MSLRSAPTVAVVVDSPWYWEKNESTIGRPVARRMNLMAISTASVPLSAMSTRVRLAGVISTSFSASSAIGSWG